MALLQGQDRYGRRGTMGTPAVFLGSNAQPLTHRGIQHPLILCLHPDRISSYGTPSRNWALESLLSWGLKVDSAQQTVAVFAFVLGALGICS